MHGGAWQALAREVGKDCATRAASAGTPGVGRIPVLSYATDPPEAIRVIRGDGVLRVVVPAVDVVRGWVREGLMTLPLFAIPLAVLTLIGLNRLWKTGWPFGVTGVAAVILVWLGLAGGISLRRRFEVVVADGKMVLELTSAAYHRKVECPLEQVLAIREGRWTVLASVERRRGKSRWAEDVTLAVSEGKAERRRLMEILRAALGLAPARGPDGGGFGPELKEEMRHGRG